MLEAKLLQRVLVAQLLQRVLEAKLLQRSLQAELLQRLLQAKLLQRLLLAQLLKCSTSYKSKRLKLLCYICRMQDDGVDVIKEVVLAGV